jgi:hypothetical protein
MNYNRIATVASRILAVGALAPIALAVTEFTANVLGYTVMHQAHSPDHLLELAAVLAVFVITLLLRQIRDELRKRQA